MSTTANDGAPCRGDVVLVLYPNADLRTAKRRPALVVQADGLNTGLSQVVVAMISSKLFRAGHPSRVFIKSGSAEVPASGLLIGAGLVFGWYSMDGASKAELNQEREKAKAALEEVKKADAETLAAEKTKIRADYEVQLKAAEDQVQSLNTELLKIRTDLVTAQAKLTNMVETVKVVEKPASKPVVVTAPVAPVPQTVSAPPTVAQPAPQQPAPVAPVKSTLREARPVGRVWHRDGVGSRRYTIINGHRVYE